MQYQIDLLTSVQSTQNTIRIKTSWSLKMVFAPIHSYAERAKKRMRFEEEKNASFFVLYLADLLDSQYIFLIIIFNIGCDAIGWLNFNEWVSAKNKWIFVTRKHHTLTQINECESQIDKALSLWWQRDDVRLEINHFYII